MKRYLPVFLALLLTCCGGGDGDVDRPAQKTARVDRGGSGGEIDMIECKGTIESMHHFSRFLREGETIAAFAVKEGARVKKGDLLLTLSDDNALNRYTQLSYRKLQFREKKNNLEILRLEIAKAKKGIAGLKEELEQEKKLAKSIDDYPAGLQAGRLKKQIQRLREDLNILQKKKDFLEAGLGEEEKIIALLDRPLAGLKDRVKGLEIRAPFDGTAVYVPSNTANPRPGDLVIEVLDNNRLVVRADVWQHQLQYIEPGREVKIFPDFFNDSSFKGKIAKIRFSPVKSAKDEYPKFPVYIDLEPGIKGLKAGMSVTVSIRSN